MKDGWICNLCSQRWIEFVLYNMDLSWSNINADSQTKDTEAFQYPPTNSKNVIFVMATTFI